MKKLGAVVLLIALFLGCSGDETYPGMKVRDRFLYTAENEKVIIRGVNGMFIWHDINGDTFKEIAKTGANTVRIVWTTGGSPRFLDELIVLCREENMIPMIELHDATGDWDKLSKCVDYWTEESMVAVIKAHQEYLLLNIANEAGDGSISPDEFERAYSEAILRIRAVGIHIPLIIDSVDWGKDINILQEKGFTLIEADPNHNLMFSVHTWWPSMWGYTEETAVKELEESVRMRLPLIVGEVGNRWDMEESGEIPYQAILEVCQKKAIGWLAWSWGPGNTPQRWLDMTEDGTFETLHDWGEEVAVSAPWSIKNTSLKPVSFGGNVKPELIPDADVWRKNKAAGEQ